jgi:hypothetical protein
MILGISLSPLPLASAANTDLPEADAAAFRAHLVQKQLDSRWEGNPYRLESTEIQRAYGDRRFYFTFKAPPVPPGARLPELIERYQKALEAHQKHSLRVTVGIEDGGGADTYRTAEDFNVGLMPISSDEDARVAAAAILSLIGNDQVYPLVINAKEVSVTQTRTGWTCRVNQQPKGIDGTVVFDASGRCVSATKNLNYRPPVPP